MSTIAVQQSELVKLADLHDHPRNYREHPEEQLEHLMHSITEHGFYRNIVITTDGTILAGHGVAEASRRLGLKEVSAIRIDVDPDSAAALKVLAADNYLPHFSEDDDRALTELLKEISEIDTLLGTGFDEAMLATLVMVTRPASEIASRDAAAEWVGMPDFINDPTKIVLVLNFDTEEHREELVKQLEITVTAKIRKTWSGWWPPRPKQDTISVFFED